MDLKKLEIKEDNRGVLVEAFKMPTDGQVFYVVAKPHSVRGNHYHLRKTENFLVVNGSAEIIVRDRVNGNTMKVEVSGEAPMVVKVVPNHTHCIAAGKGGCMFLVWADELFDEKDPDTIPEEV